MAAVIEVEGGGENFHRVLQVGGGGTSIHRVLLAVGGVNIIHQVRVEGGEGNFHRIKSPLDWRLAVVQPVVEEGTMRTLIVHSQPPPYSCKGEKRVGRKRRKINLHQNHLPARSNLVTIVRKRALPPLSHRYRRGLRNRTNSPQLFKHFQK